MKRILVLAAAIATLAAPRSAPAASDRTANAAGIVTVYSASTRTFSLASERGETLAFSWTKETKFNGVVARGAKVTVRYTLTSDGKAVAQTVGVVR